MSELIPGFIDTHCHMHMDGYQLDAVAELEAARKVGLQDLVLIGEGHNDSLLALEFAKTHGLHAAVGLHPHNADDYEIEIPKLTEIAKQAGSPLVAIGECGLDYYYDNSHRDMQKTALKMQIELALELNLPLVFHVRGSKQDPTDAFKEFFILVDNYQSVRGVVHSFTAEKSILTEVIKRNLFVGINGIVTFANDENQLQAVRAVPDDKLLLETDAPFLTPAPFRGKINSPKYLVEVISKLAVLRSGDPEVIMAQTTKNARNLFSI